MLKKKLARHLVIPSTNATVKEADQCMEDESDYSERRHARGTNVTDDDDIYKLKESLLKVKRSRIKQANSVKNEDLRGVTTH